MGVVGCFTARHLHLKPESRPQSVRLVFFADRSALAVEARDHANRPIVRLDLRSMRNWLFLNCYSWVPGSSGIWARL